MGSVTQRGGPWRTARRGPSAVTSTGERGRPSGGEMGPSALQPAARCCVRAAHWAWPPPTRPRASGEGHKEDCCRGFAGEPAAAVHRGPGGAGEILSPKYRVQEWRGATGFYIHKSHDVNYIRRPFGSKRFNKEERSQREAARWTRARIREATGHKQGSCAGQRRGHP